MTGGEVMIEKSKLFFAQLPERKVAYGDLIVTQQWAVNLGVDKNQKIHYLLGKGATSKSEVALQICERLEGRVHAGAVTGKAASNFSGPTVHGMFGWSSEGDRYGRGNLYIIYSIVFWLAQQTAVPQLQLLLMENQ
jgi:hypothetical protein